VAVSDGLGLTAQPRVTLARHGGVRDIETIRKVLEEEDADRIVLGLPIDPQGQEGPAAARVRVFGEKLRAALHVPVELIDESYSTVEAEEVLLAAHVSRARRKQVVDKLAASVILQRWLDAERTRKDSIP